MLAYLPNKIPPDSTETKFGAKSVICPTCAERVDTREKEEIRKGQMSRDERIEGYFFYLPQSANKVS